MVLIFAMAAIAVATVMVWSFIRALLRSPDYVSQYLRNRRGVRGYRAVSQGLIAVGSGDARAARKFSAEANRIAPNEPLTLLLNAQAAQLAGNREAAAATFDRMAGRDDTRVLGLHGLFIEARRRQDPGAALYYAEEAAKQTPVPAWAGQAVLEFRCVAGDWSGALTRLEKQHERRPHRQGGVSAPARGIAHRAGARRRRRRCLGDRGQARGLIAGIGHRRRQPRAGHGAGARSGEARARPGAGGGACRPAPGRSGRPAQGRTHHRDGLADQSASRSGRRPMRICAPAIPRASGWRACRRSRARRPATSRERSRWRAPHSTPGSSPSHARRWRRSSHRRRNGWRR